MGTKFVDFNNPQNQLTMNKELTSYDENVNLINARMNTFTKLEKGSTTADAEIADIRIGADGTTYENAGEAVRGQVNNLKQDLANTKNELKDILKTEIGINKIKEMYPLSTLSGLIVGNIYQNPFATNKVDNTNVDISGLIDIEKDKSYYFYSIANEIRSASYMRILWSSSRVYMYNHN